MPDAREHGAYILSGIIPDRVDRLVKANRVLVFEQFIDTAQQQLFFLLQKYYEQNGGVLSESALEDLTRNIDPGRAQVYRETYLDHVAGEVPETQYDWSISQLRELASERATTEALSDAMEIIRTGKEVEGEVVKGAEEARGYLTTALAAIDRNVTMQAAPEGDVRDEQKDVLEDYEERKRITASGASLGVLFGINALDERIGGLQRGEVALIAGYSSDGKCEAVSSSILTPSGYRRMGDLQVGDKVLDTYGGSSTILGVYPQGERDIYRLEFSDGSWAESSEDHLWTVRRRMPVRHRQADGTIKQVATEVERTYTTAQMMPMMSWTNSRPYLPDIAPVRFSNPLPEGLLDPYLIGLLLGDGTLGQGSIEITTPDEQVIQSVRDLIPEDCVVVFKQKKSAATTYRINGLRKHLLASGVSLVNSPEKRVPAAYLWASDPTDRLAALQGLMDTDGWVEKGSGDFASSSEGLRNDVVFLARSLGIRASVGKPKETHYLYKNELLPGLPSYRTALGHHPELFRLERKLVLLQEPERIRRRVLQSITFVRREEAQCIRVSAENSLYLTQSFVPTHNTTMITQAAWSAAVEQGKNVVFFTTETLRDQVRRKLLARHSMLEKFDLHLSGGINSYDIKNGTIPAPIEERWREVVEDFTTNPDYGILYIKQVPRGATLSYIEQNLNSLGRKFNVDIVFIDSLYLLAPDRKRNSTREELASLMKDSKQVATTVFGGRGVPIVSPWQVSRNAREKAEDLGKYTSASLSETAEATNTSDIIIGMLAPIDNSERRVHIDLQILKARDGPTANDLRVEVDYGTSWFRSRTRFSAPSAVGAIHASQAIAGGDDLANLIST